MGRPPVRGPEDWGLNSFTMTPRPKSSQGTGPFSGIPGESFNLGSRAGSGETTIRRRAPHDEFLVLWAF